MRHAIFAEENALQIILLEAEKKMTIYHTSQTSDWLPRALESGVLTWATPAALHIISIEG
jgi:hypothetical protein